MQNQLNFWSPYKGKQCNFLNGMATLNLALVDLIGFNSYDSFPVTLLAVEPAMLLVICNFYINGHNVTTV